jgi:DNA repair protein RadC
VAITDWPADDRPREKLLQKGAAALSDAELVAIFLRTGVTGKSAVDLARDMLNEFGSLTALCGADQAAFCKIHGLGVAKFVQLQAVLEMAQRALGETLKRGEALHSPRAVRDFLWLRLHNQRAKPRAGGGKFICRYAHPHQRLSARSGQARAASQRGRGDFCPKCQIYI